MPDAIFIVQVSVCSSGIELQHSTGMGSYHQPVPEICTLKCGAFNGEEHVVVVTRKGKEGFLCTQLSRKINTGAVHYPWQVRKINVVEISAPCVQVTSMEDSMHIHKNGQSNYKYF